MLFRFEALIDPLLTSVKSGEFVSSEIRDWFEVL